MYSKKSKAIRPTKAMFKHLNRFYLSDWRHKHTYKSPKKREPPFLRPVNRLRHSPCPHSQVHLRPPAAPPVRVSHQQAAPGERARRKGARVSFADQPSRGESIREKQREEEKSKRKSQEEEGAPRACPSFMERGSALRSAPFRAPPPFWKLPKKGAFPTPGSVTPRVHQSGASRPTPPPSHSSEKTGRQNPRASRNSCSFLSRSALVIVVVGGRWV